MNLTSKLIMPVVVGYLMLAGALYFVWEPKQLDRSIQQYIEQQQLALKSISTIVEPAVLEKDVAEINLRLDQAWQTYETNWNALVLEQQSGPPLYLAGIPDDDALEFLDTIEEPFMRDGYKVATLRADVDYSPMVGDSYYSMLHVQMLLLFVFMAVVIVSLVITETFVKLPMLRLQQAARQPDETTGDASSSADSGNKTPGGTKPD